MAVEPTLQALDVLLGAGEPVARLLGEIRVGLVGGGTALIDDHASERDEDADHGGGEERVDDHHPEPPRKLDARQVADERVERERDDRCGQEQEEDVREV